MKKRTIFLIIIFCRVLTGEAQQAVAYYPFTGNANDFSGRNNHAISLGGAVAAPDQYNKPNAAYHFNGASVITVPNSTSLALENEMSVAALVKAAATPPAAGTRDVFTIISKTAGAGNNMRKWIFGLQNGRLALHINAPGNGIGNWVYSTPFPLVINSFYHFAFTKTGRAVTFYVNGNVTGTAQLTIDLLDPPAPLTIGYSEAGMYMNGTMDEVRIYNAVLQQPDVTALPVKISSFYCLQNSKYPALYWTTSVQENVDRYEIEKSLDAQTFRSIGARKAVQNHYAYNLADSETVQSQYIYYRIKIYDTDGRKSLSRVIRITPDAGSGLNIRSNFAVPHSFSITNDGAEKNVVLIVLHSSGAKVLQEKITVGAGAVITKQIAGAGGMYFVSLTGPDGAGLKTEKILVR